MLLAVVVMLLAGGFRSSPPPIRPGGKIGTMTLVRGIEHRADDEIWRFCKGLIPKPGAVPPDVFRPSAGAALHRLRTVGENAEGSRLPLAAVEMGPVV